MKLYLVRHGQSIGNLEKIEQESTSPLSDTGREQSKKLAKKLKAISIDIILTSHYTRAYETSEILSTEIIKPLEKNELLREIKRPSEIEGKLVSDEMTSEIRKMIKANIHDPKWHYGDEENISDLINRAKNFIKYLEQRKEENIVAVSHGRIIQAIVEVVILGDALTPRVFEEIKENLYLANTGVVVLENTDNHWHLLTWNDHNHLKSAK